ncbi:hypothetical protein HYH03_004361 [Edaphochlamys debaryana]|uniref:RING-CH-type domain-containing protein n=1 Tax=Edaphochlamys debaryana TaxID=47281 RepID=A0A836C299_9CHLO|nr:hypothetical protein HYH03_004361 [Edaphochlamys debaryana]|eukprot:KAG2497620.1 hypothetical protein HYH03_004361 [Edaphochlamys debaryana]
MMDVPAARDRDQQGREPRGKRPSVGHEVACRGGPVIDDVLDTSTSDETGDVCWVCLDGASPSRPLIRPCKCPRYCHSVCIARWQLQSAGSRKETHCEFCQSRLPEWRNALTPSCGSQAPATMNVCFGGRTFSFEVQPGPEGYRRFTAAIRAAFALPDDSELNITFTCDEPNSGRAQDQARGSLLTLQGAGAYDAAVHCASVSAARRISHGHSPAQGPMWPGGAGSPAGGGGGGSASSSRRNSSGGGSTGGGVGAGPGAAAKSRVLSGLGRRLRNAVADLFGASTGLGGSGSGSGSGAGSGGAAAATTGSGSRPGSRGGAQEVASR